MALEKTGIAHLGARIRARRSELALSQGRLADAVGITASAVSQIESGAMRTLKDDTLARVALALQTTVLELTAGLPAHNEALTSAEKQLLQDFRHLSAPLQQIALKLVKALG